MHAPPANPPPPAEFSWLRTQIVRVYLRMFFAPLTRPLMLRALLLREQVTTGGTIDFLSPAFLHNPYPTYAWLRTHDPVHWSGLAHGWLLTRYADVQAALRDPRFSVERERMAGFHELMRALDCAGPTVEFFSRSLLGCDPPAHTRLRRLVGPPFSASAVAQMRGRVEAIVDVLLDRMPESQPVDLMTALAEPLPIAVIAEFLGVPSKDAAQLKSWSDALAAVTDPVVDRPALRRADEAAIALTRYFQPLIGDRRVHTGDDLLSALVMAEEAGDRLSEPELYAMSILLLAAGNETTTNVIGNGMLTLLSHPEAVQSLRDDPNLIAPAVEELLRFDSSVQFTSRVVTEEMELHGNRIQAGQRVLMGLGSANRDEAAFVDPDRLIWQRSEPRPIAFGAGVHTCLGAPLARMEAEVALHAVLRRWPDIRLAGTPRWRSMLTLRGLASLPVVLERSSPRVVETS